MIEARNLVKVYKPKRGVAVRALDGVSLKLPATGMVFLLGKSGSGKSTLLNVLGGLDSYDDGEIFVKGTSTKHFKQKHFDSYRNTYVGFIFQEYNILEEFTVGANIALALELQGKKATNEAINEILAEVDLLEYGNRKPNELSGGQKQRVAIARALIKKPEIIMADEPTGALDSNTGKQVFDTLKKLSRDKLVVVVSHDREFAEQYADRIIELADGKIISDVSVSGEEGKGETFDALEYRGDEIKIAGGYELTEEDRLAINRYIAALKNGATLKIGSEQKRAKTNKKFTPTDQKSIKTSEGKFSLIKSKLSIKHAFKIGASGLKHKKFRLVLTILLSFVAFTLFGLADTIAAYDNYSTSVNSIMDSGIDYAAFVKSQEVGTDYTYWNNTKMSDSDITSLKEQTGLNLKGVYPSISATSNGYSGSSGISFADYAVTTTLGNKSILYTTSFSGITELTQSDLTAYGYTLDGALPDGTKDEIAVTEYVYELFKQVGFTYKNDKNETKNDAISSHADLIGRELQLGASDNYYGDATATSYKITGIVDTKFDVSRYESLATNESSVTALMLSSELEYAKSYSLHAVAFVGDGFISNLLSSNNIVGTQISSLGNISIGKENANGEGYSYLSHSYIAKLSEIGKANVTFFDSTKTSLNDGEVVIYLNTNNRNNIFGNILYYAEISGEEYELMSEYYAKDNRTLNDYDKTLSVFLNQFDQYANFKYRKEMNDESLIAPQSYIDEYYATIYNKYAAMKKACISPSKLSEYTFTYTYDGEEHTLNKDKSYMLINLMNDYQTACYKYISQHIDDAVAWWNKENSQEEGVYYDTNIENIVNNYFSYVSAAMNKANNGSDMTEDEQAIVAAVKTIKDEIARDVMKIAYDNGAFDGYKLTGYVTSTGGTPIEKDVTVVGYVYNTTDIGDSKATLVMSDADVNSFTGGQEAGIYGYCVGAMDNSDRSLVGKCVTISNNEEGGVKFSLTNSVTLQLDMLNSMLEILGSVFLYVGLGFALFAALMLSNFIATSISYKRQEIGILRAIGSRGWDVFKIFFAESFIISMINFVLSLAATIAVTIILNGVFRTQVGMLITILSFGIRQVALLLGVSLLVALIATFLPVKKIASQKPIDAIRKR